MSALFSIFGFLAPPLGWLYRQIYALFSNYFITLFIFTFLIRLITFPIYLRSAKVQSKRIMLAPRVERLQKKYSQDRQKLQQKQQELYQKEGISMTAGCLPMLIPMIIMFVMITVIYSPIKYATDINATVENTVIDTIIAPKQGELEIKYEADNIKAGQTKEDAAKNAADKAKAEALKGYETTNYYRELNILKNIDNANEDQIKANIAALPDADRNGETADKYWNTLINLKKQFTILGQSVLDNPSTGNLNLLWLIPILSALTALVQSYLSLRYSKMGMSKDAQMPGQGCSNVMMLIAMPAFSLFITFTVNGSVGIYWIFSNLIGLLQVFVTNTIYHPGKIRAAAEIADEERRRQRAEDKKRLAETKKREEEEARKAAEAEKKANKMKPGQNKSNQSKPKKEEKTKEEEKAADLMPEIPELPEIAKGLEIGEIKDD